MRRPTPDSALYAWHSARLSAGVLADDEALFHNDPQCGWYKRRLVKKGPFVAARIFVEREIDEATGELLTDEIMRCEVAGEFHDPEDQWNWLWEYPITEAEYNFMKAVAYHAAWHEPSAPEANPRKPINWQTVMPPKFNSSNGEKP